MLQEGVYELEGELESCPLPTSLLESIRLRLSAVQESDAPVFLLLQVAAVLGGSFSSPQLQVSWDPPLHRHHPCPIIPPFYRTCSSVAAGLGAGRAFGTRHVASPRT